ncbi:uncharacterized protein LOC105254573 isoform X2 [Camponotus floridanus]|uniref:uncharacterized protein LOC105254573 isoform X2 n=1 Tax=Camponotus floridanus TaxID=104421 RepID=UPI00059E9112|nr:uncharacterized protein LOC105254573 isoform X2 [Camponotus floridanus]
MTMTTTTMTTMFERKKDTMGLTNGNGNLAEDIQKEKPTRFWTKIHLNEWTFSLSLLVLSLFIVIGKLYANYGKCLLWKISDQYSLPSITTFAQVYDTIPNISVLSKFGVKQLPADSEKFLKTSHQYAEAASNMLVTFYERYNWLMKATMSGLMITSFSWFILYKDSSIPGVNPPFPFSPSRQRIDNNSRIQINYLVGALNGILFFIYMCL